MRFSRSTLAVGAVALLTLGSAAVAAEKMHVLHVALPDGAVANIEYAGDVAPKVTVQPGARPVAVMIDPFAAFDQMAAAMEAQQAQMALQVAALQRAAQAGGDVAAVPAGVHYSYVSTTTDANGCTQTVQYSSDGKGGAPQVTRASAGSCHAVRPAAPVEASASAPADSDTRDGQKV